MAPSSRLPAGHTAPPPPPPKQPPPALPPIASTSTLPSTTPTPNPPTQLNATHQTALWKKRVSLLADYEQGRARVSQLNDSRELALRMVQSSHFKRLPESEQRRLRVELEELTTKHQTALEGQDRVLQSIVDHNGSWPVGPIKEQDRALAQTEEIYREVARLITELREVVDHTRRTFIGRPVELDKEFPKLSLRLDGDQDMQDGTAAKGGTTTKVQENPNDDSGSAMDIDPSTPSSPTAPITAATLPVVGPTPTPSEFSRKRRRTETGPTDDLFPKTDPDPEEWLERLSALENDASSLRNSILQFRRDQKGMLEEAVEDAVEQFSDRLREDVLKIRKRMRETQEAYDRQYAEDQAMLNSLREDVKVVGDDLTEVSLSVAQLVDQNSKLEERLAVAKKERDEGYQRIAEIEKKLDSYAKAREARQSQIRTLQVAIDAYKSRAEAAALTPSSTDAEPIPQTTLHFLLSTLTHPLAQQIRPQLQPILDELRENVEGMVQRGSADIYGSVVEKLNKLNLVWEQRLASQAQAQAHAQADAPPQASTSTQGQQTRTPPPLRSPTGALAPPAGHPMSSLGQHQQPPIAGPGPSTTAAATSTSQPLPPPTGPSSHYRSQYGAAFGAAIHAQWPPPQRPGVQSHGMNTMGPPPRLPPGSSSNAPPLGVHGTIPSRSPTVGHHHPGNNAYQPQSQSKPPTPTRPTASPSGSNRSRPS